MTKDELKPILKDFLTGMMNDWFSDKPIWKTLGNSLITANINKYDNVLDMFADEHGDIDVEGIINNIGDAMEDSFKIDLQEFSPLLPNRILLISKQDIKNLLSSVYEK
jgi:hypothetical protein